VRLPALRLREKRMREAIDFKARYVDLLKSSLCSSLYDESAWRRIAGPLRQEVRGRPLKLLKRAVIRAILRAAARRKVLLLRKLPYDDNARRQGLDWPLFGYTMTGRNRLDALHRCLETIIAEKVPGDVVETGVWRGGSMILARALLDVHGETDRLVWCCDSFEGMPVPTVAGESFSGTEDFSDLDYLAVGVDQVKANFARFGVDLEYVRFLKGWFSDTLPQAPIGTIALLRLDGDLYESTRDALVPLYPRVSKGGFVIVDDYDSWAGCKKAVDDYRARHGVTAPIVKIDAHAVYWRVD
jgi:hypothetical protein